MLTRKLLPNDFVSRYCQNKQLLRIDPHAQCWCTSKGSITFICLSKLIMTIASGTVPPGHLMHNSTDAINRLLQDQTVIPKRSRTKTCSRLVVGRTWGTDDWGCADTAAGWGEDPPAWGTLKTPAGSWGDAFLNSGWRTSLKELVNDAIFDEGHNEMVLVDINFFQLMRTPYVALFMGKLTLPIF